MGRRMWMALGAAAVLVAPAACGADDGEVATDGDEAVEADSGAVEAAPTAAFMARVAENTSEAPAYELTLTVSAEGMAEVGDGTLMTAEGTFAGDGEQGRMTLDMSPMLESLGGELGADEGLGLEGLLDGLAEPWEIVTDGDTTYMSGGFLVSMLGAETEWISMPTESGSADPTGGLSDPGAFLDLLGEAGEVTEQGTESIGGVDTTHYTVEVDLEALAETAAEESGAEVPDIPGLGGTEMVVDVWVDEGAQQVRRIELLMEGDEFAASTGTPVEGSMRVTMDLTPLDEPVQIEVPDPADVTPADELGGGLFGGLGG